MKLGWSLPKRKQYLSQLVATESTKTHLVPFQGKRQYLKVYSVPIDLPLYRLENGRTTGLQAEYIAANPAVGKDFFRTDSELETAQEAQHQILTRLARIRKDLFKEFEKADQEEPIILSHTGYVVNGNRRLSTWRQLYMDDPSKYERFHSIECVILPLCDERELDRIEAELQLKEDLKADYSWTSRALMMREKMSRFHYSQSEIASIYGLKKKELDEYLDILDYADQYLETRGVPSKYSEVDDKEFAFRQISRSRQKLRASNSLKELFEKSSFCLADEPGEGSRTYAEIPKIADHIDEIAENLKDEFNVEADGKSLDEVAQNLSDLLTEEDNFEKARTSIRDTIEAADSRKKNKKKREYVSTLILKARDNLRDALQAKNNKSTKDGAAQALNEIEAMCTELKDWANDNS